MKKMMGSKDMQKMMKGNFFLDMMANDEA